MTGMIYIRRRRQRQYLFTSKRFAAEASKIGGILIIVQILQIITTSALSPRIVQRYRCIYYTAIQGSQDSNQEESPQVAKEFLRWMYDVKGCQGDDNAIELSTKNGRRGLYAAQDVARGDYVFAVPFESALLIEEEETSDAERGKKFLQLQRQLQAHPDYKQAWKPYMDILPSSRQEIDPTPDFWNKKEIQQLELPLFVQRVLEKKQNIEMIAATDPDTLDIDELQLATWLVNSRAVTLLDNTDNDEIDDEMINDCLGRDDDADEALDEDDYDYDDDNDSVLSTTCVLIPLVDMINHSSEDFNTDLSVMGNSGDGEDDSDEEQLYYAVVANQDISKGEELLISYGSQEDTSCDLLLHYGFVPDQSPYDVDFLAWSGAAEEMPKCWSTTLQEDEQRIQEIDTTGDYNCMEETLLRFRIRMKRAYEEYQSLLAAAQSL